MRKTIFKIFPRNSLEIIFILIMINSNMASNMNKTFAEEFYFLENSQLISEIKDYKNTTEIFYSQTFPLENVNLNNRDISYLDGSQNDSKNNTINPNFFLKDAGEIAAWLLIIIILAPCIVFFTIFLVCCNFVFSWCKPRRHTYHDFAPPLLIRQQGYRRYDPSSNFNA